MFLSKIPIRSNFISSKEMIGLWALFNGWAVAKPLKARLTEPAAGRTIFLLTMWSWRYLWFSKFHWLPVLYNILVLEETKVVFWCCDASVAFGLAIGALDDAKDVALTAPAAGATLPDFMFLRSLRSSSVRPISLRTMSRVV